MKRLFVVLWCAVALCEGYTVEPKYHHFSSDNVMKPGTRMNPYVVKDGSGRIIGEIKPKHYDFNPAKDPMDPGTRLNPYVIEFRER